MSFLPGFFVPLCLYYAEQFASIQLAFPYPSLSMASEGGLSLWWWWGMHHTGKIMSFPCLIKRLVATYGVAKLVYCFFLEEVTYFYSSLVLFHLLQW